MANPIGESTLTETVLSTESWAAISHTPLSICTIVTYQDTIISPASSRYRNYDHPFWLQFLVSLLRSVWQFKFRFQANIRRFYVASYPRHWFDIHGRAWSACHLTATAAVSFLGQHPSRSGGIHVQDIPRYFHLRRLLPDEMEMIDFTLELSKLNFVIRSIFRDATSLRKVRTQEDPANIERSITQRARLINSCARKEEFICNNREDDVSSIENWNRSFRQHTDLSVFRLLDLAY